MCRPRWRGPHDPASLERANRFLEDVNRRAGSSALYVMNLQGKTLAASNWALPGSFVGHVYRDRPVLHRGAQRPQGACSTAWA